MKDNIWQLQEAKSEFNQLVENAIHKGPQIVTKHGDHVVVVLSAAEYEKIVRPETGLVEFLRSSPLTELDQALDQALSRNKDLPKDRIL